MIQRIQSIYLLLAGIFPAITFFTPVAFCYADDRWLAASSFTYEAQGITELAGKHPWGVCVLALLSICFAFVALLNFRKRTVQLRWTWAALGCNVLWYFTLGTYLYSVAHRVNMPLSISSLNLCSLLPLLAIVMLLLARRGILHDEALVKAADRIR